MPLLLSIFGATYALIASEKIDKTTAAICGAALVLLFHLVPYDKALEYIDLNVIFLLVGMMMIVGIMARTGLFEWIAIEIAKRTHGNGLAILVLFLVVTAVFSAFLDNVTTVILIAPLTILVCQLLELPTVPFLILEAIFSNIGGTATLVGDPPNILIGSEVGLTFGQFLGHLSPIVMIIGMVVLLGTVIFFHKQMRTKETLKARVLNAQPELAILNKRQMIWSLIIFALVILGFFCARLINVEPGVIALTGGFVMATLCRVDIHSSFERVDWGSIFFFIGLFILIGSLQERGVFEWAGEHILRLTGGNLLHTALAILWLSAIASAIVDNIPLVIAMIPLIQAIIPSFAEQMGIATDPLLIQRFITEPLFWSLALGACLGGNGTLIGASANVVISQIAKRNRYHISFWKFAAYGLPIMFVSMLFCTVYIYLRYFKFVTMP